MSSLDQAKAAYAPVDKDITTVRQRNAAIAGSAPSPAAAAYKTTVTAPKDRVGQKSYGSNTPEKRIDVSGMVKPLGSFKKGGKVKKTGAYKLHKGEVVVPAKTVKKAKGKALAGMQNALKAKK